MKANSIKQFENKKINLKEKKKSQSRRKEKNMKKSIVKRLERSPDIIRDSLNSILN